MSARAFVYQHLANEAGNHAPLVVVFPSGKPEPEKYLAARQVKANRTVSASFPELGIRATPTLLIVDEGGKIERAWVGALTEEKHREVLESARLEM